MQTGRYGLDLRLTNFDGSDFVRGRTVWRTGRSTYLNRSRALQLCVMRAADLHNVLYGYGK